MSTWLCVECECRELRRTVRHLVDVIIRYGVQPTLPPAIDSAWCWISRDENMFVISDLLTTHVLIHIYELVRIRLLGVASHIREIYTLLVPYRTNGPNNLICTANGERNRYVTPLIQPCTLSDSNHKDLLNDVIIKLCR